MKKLLLITICMVLLIGSVSAFDFDNIKEYDKDNEEITIKNAFGLPIIGDDIAKIKLESNTDNCLIDCEASGTITLYTKGYLFQEMNFKNSFGEDTSIKSYEALVEVTTEYEEDVPIVTTNCQLDVVGKNGTMAETCTDEITGTRKIQRTRTEYVDAFNTVLEPGTYNWIIKGRKNPQQSVDWVGTSFGNELDEWAWWNALWNKKQEIKIQGQTATMNYTNFSVPITVEYDSDMQADFDDIRFTNGSETFEIPYFQENVLIGNHSNYTVKVPFVSQLNQSIYMYYSNAAAGNTSNYTTAHLFADDFGGDSLSGLWNQQSDVNGAFNITVSNGYLWFNGSASRKGYVITKQNYTSPDNFPTEGGDFVIETAILGYTIGSGNNPYVGVVTGWNTSAGMQDYDGATTGFETRNGVAGSYGASNTNWRMDGWEAGTPISGSSLDPAPDPSAAEVLLEVFSKRVGANRVANMSHDGVESAASEPTAYLYGINTSLMIWGREAITARYDYIELKRWAEVNPTATFEAEQTGTDIVTSLASPTDASSSINSTQKFSGVYTVASGSIQNATLYIWNNTGGDLVNLSFTTVTDATNNSNITVPNIPSGEYKWNYVGCIIDDLAATQCDMASSNYTLTLNTLVVNAQTFNATTTETSDEGFSVNITYDPAVYSFVSAILNYNGTDYTGTSTTVGPDTIFSRSLTTPSFEIDSTVGFNWRFLSTHAGGISQTNSSFNNQTINAINASIYGKPYTPTYINFTTYDEESLVAINSTFYATINYGKSSLIKNLSYQNTVENITNYQFSFFPNGTYLVEGTVSYSSTGYNSRVYTIPQQSVNNNTITTINLYLINSSDSTSFVVKVRDSSYTSIQGAVVHVQRYYPGTNEWQTTEVLTTNYEGKAIGHFVTEDVDYRFLVYVDGVLSLTSTSTKIFCEASPCTITLTIPGAGGLQQFGNLTDLDFSFYYTKSTEIFTYSFNDASAFASGGRLKVIRSLANTTEITVCNTASGSSSAVLTCDISLGLNGTYIAIAFNNRTTTKETRVDTLLIQKTRNIVASVGDDGLLWVVFLIMGLVMIGLAKPAIAIILAVAGVIFIGLLGIASIPWVTIIALIFIALIILWEMRS